jgi:hypothetical protein
MINVIGKSNPLNRRRDGGKKMAWITNSFRGFSTVLLRRWCVGETYCVRVQGDRIWLRWKSHLNQNQSPWRPWLHGQTKRRKTLNYVGSKPTGPSFSSSRSETQVLYVRTKHRGWVKPGPQISVQRCYHKVIRSIHVNADTDLRRVKVKVKFTLEQTMKAQTGRTNTTLFL